MEVVVYPLAGTQLYLCGVSILVDVVVAPGTGRPVTLQCDEDTQAPPTSPGVSVSEKRQRSRTEGKDTAGHPLPTATPVPILKEATFLI